LYEHGSGVPLDTRRALEWYQKGAAGSAYATRMLGRFLLFTSGPEKNPSEGCRHLLIAAKAGDTGAAYGIGYCLESGVGVDKDEAAAAYWFTEAAKHGHGPSEHELGLLYLSGRGVPEDHAAAEKWFSQAAAHGEDGAKRALANLRERQHCEASAKTELFGVKLLCGSRQEFRRALARANVTPRQVDDRNWYDEYESTQVLDGSGTLDVWFTSDGAWMGRAVYDFPSNVDVEQVFRVMLMVGLKYGHPRTRSGNLAVGPVRFEWTLPDGVRVVVRREWPDTTTYLEYQNPRRLPQMEREIKEADRRAKNDRVREQSGAF